MLKDVKEIRTRIHQVLQDRLEEGWCLASRHTKDTGFSFQSDDHNGLGCIVGVILGDEYTKYSLNDRETVAARLDISYDDLIAIEVGFEGAGVNAVVPDDEYSQALKALGVEIRETYNA